MSDKADTLRYLDMHMPAPIPMSRDEVIRLTTALGMRSTARRTTTPKTHKPHVKRERKPRRKNPEILRLRREWLVAKIARYQSELERIEKEEAKNENR